MVSFAELSPLELSAFLNALPCSLAFHRDASFEFKDLIKEVKKIIFIVDDKLQFKVLEKIVNQLVLLIVEINMFLKKKKKKPIDIVTDTQILQLPVYI